MTLPTNKHDLTAITTQRDQIGRLIRCEESRSNITDAQDTEVLDTTENAGAPLLAEVARSGEVDNAPAPIPAAVARSHEVDPDANDPMQQDPPDWIVQQASLSELLLWRLGIPIDRELIEREHQRSQESIDLKPPITTRKVAAAIAHLSLQLIEGKLDANSAKTSLYALQTLLTALRLQIVEEKKAKAITKKKSPRRKLNAKRKR